jgi:F-type H+-transporting ATPase subunit a
MNTLLANTPLHVSLTAEPLFHIGGVAITNSMVLGFIGTILVVWLTFYAAKLARKGSKSRFLGLFQWMFESLYAQINDIISDKKLARSIAPLAITIFIFVLVNYWPSFLPLAPTTRAMGTMPNPAI